MYDVSFDGFDGTGETTYTTAQEQAHKLEAYIRENCGGHLDVLFAESLGCGPVILLKSSPQVQIDHMILSGPEYLDFGILNKLLLKVMPQKQYKTVREKSMPRWALRFMGQTEQGMNTMLRRIYRWNPSGPHGRWGYISIGCRCRCSRMHRSPVGMAKRKDT